MTYQVMQSFIGQTIYMITNLKREMPKYKASQVRNNVILIILIALQVYFSQSISNKYFAKH